MSKIGLFYLAIFMLALLSACDKDEAPIVQDDPIDVSDDDMDDDPIDEDDDPVITEKYTYLALGDSYTIGQSVEESARWPNQLSVRLKEEANKESTEVAIIAQTGWTTYNLLQAIENKNPKNYDMVSLLIGVNNQFQGAPFSQFETQFNTLLDIAVELAGGTENVFVVSIPDYGVTPFGSSNKEQIAMELDQYNAYSEQQCNSRGIAYVNITGISRSLGASPSALAVDQLHPSGYQYSRWVEEILPVAVHILEK